MRAPSPSLLLLGTAAAPGCVECEGPESLEGVYDVFANVVEYDGTNLAEFPADTSPANGPSEWTFIVDEAAFTVLIDDATFAGDAQASTVECGRFSLAFFGEYEKDGDMHVIDAVGDYLVVGDTLEGRWDFEEDWTSGKQSGSFEAVGNVHGVRVGQPFDE